MESSNIDKLERLKELFDAGILTKEELELEKSKILGTSPLQPLLNNSGSTQDAIPNTHSNNSRKKTIIIWSVVIAILLAIGIVLFIFLLSKQSYESRLAEVVQMCEENGYPIIAQSNPTTDSSHFIVYVQNDTVFCNSFEKDSAPKRIFTKGTFFDVTALCIDFDNLGGLSVDRRILDCKTLNEILSENNVFEPLSALNYIDSPNSDEFAIVIPSTKTKYLYYSQSMPKKLTLLDSITYDTALHSFVTRIAGDLANYPWEDGINSEVADLIYDKKYPILTSLTLSDSFGAYSFGSTVRTPFGSIPKSWFGSSQMNEIKTKIEARLFKEKESMEKEAMSVVSDNSKKKFSDDDDDDDLSDALGLLFLLSLF